MQLPANSISNRPLPRATEPLYSSLNLKSEKQAEPQDSPPSQEAIDSARSIGAGLALGAGLMTAISAASLLGLTVIGTMLGVATGGVVAAALISPLQDHFEANLTHLAKHRP